MKNWKSSNLRQFVKFGLIGVLNTATHGIVLSLLVEGLAVSAVTGNLFAFMVANVVSYNLNCRITFKVSLSFYGYLKFFLSSLLSLALTLVISWVAERLGFHYLQGFIAIIIIVPLFSFLIMKAYVFHSKSV
jgi:putative flippase GtrA